MADKCTVPELVRNYNNPTSQEARTIMLQAYHLAWVDMSHGAIPEYEEFLNSFTKSSIKDLNIPIVMDKPGLMPVYFPGILRQGHHWAPMRQIAARGTHWTAKNPIRIRAKISRYAGENHLMETDQQIRVAIQRETYSFMQSFGFFFEMFVSLLFQTDEEWKKVGSSKADGSDGINAEMHKIYFPTDGATKGYRSYMQDLSIEHNFLCWKDGEVALCNEKGSEGKPYTVTTHPIKVITDALRACIHANVIQTSKATGKIYTNQYTEDYAKWIGLLHDTRKHVMIMKKDRTSKYNIGMNAADMNKLCSEECQKLLKDYGINLGCCTECKENGEKQCCCYNQTRATTEELEAVMHYNDYLEIEKGFPFMANPSYLESLKEYLGVSKIWLKGCQKTGDILVINKKSLGRYPVGETIYGAAETPEAELVNVWIESKFHFIINRFHCVTFRKEA